MGRAGAGRGEPRGGRRTGRVASGRALDAAAPLLRVRGVRLVDRGGRGIPRVGTCPGERAGAVLVGHGDRRGPARDRLLPSPKGVRSPPFGDHARGRSSRHREAVRSAAVHADQPGRPDAGVHVRNAATDGPDIEAGRDPGAPRRSLGAWLDVSVHPAVNRSQGAVGWLGWGLLQWLHRAYELGSSPNLLMRPGWPQLLAPHEPGRGATRRQTTPPGTTDRWTALHGSGGDVTRRQSNITLRVWRPSFGWRPSRL